MHEKRSLFDRKGGKKLGKGDFVRSMLSPCLCLLTKQGGQGVMMLFVRRLISLYVLRLVRRHKRGGEDQARRNPFQSDA
jgi:hypothetical protein